MNFQSERVKKIKPSATLLLAARAAELQLQGKNIISLTVGEPDWNTLEVAKNAGIEAIEKGLTKYTPSNGLLSLRKEIAKDFNQFSNSNYTPDEITVSAGGKFILHSILQSYINPMDEVIIPAPYWVSYTTLVEMAEGKPKIVNCKKQNNFRITSEELESAISKKTKAIILNSPSNPTGLIYSESELKKLSEVLLKHKDVLIISDDIYNRLCFYQDSAPNLLKIEPRLKDQFVSLNGGSKQFSMTGWRIGWAIGPKELIQAMNRFQSQTVSCASSISQVAVEKGLISGLGEIKGFNLLLKNRLNFIKENAKLISPLEIVYPEGAFYLWVDISSCLGKTFSDGNISNSTEFSEALLNQFGIAVVPGIEFGDDHFIRMSFCLTENKLLDAFKRISQFLSELR